MARALYVVILSRDSWWVDFEGRAHGPYATRDIAAAEAHLAAVFNTGGHRPVDHRVVAVAEGA